MERGRVLCRKLTIRLLLLGTLLGSMGTEAPAAPIISSASGTLSHGSTLTITGSGFGAKVPAAPVKWDDFEWGTPGQPLTNNGWKHYFDSSPFPLLTDSVKYAGSFSAHRQIGGSPTVQSDYLSLPSPSVEMFASYRYYLDHIPNLPGDGKPSRFNAVEVYSGNPALRHAYQVDSNWSFLLTNNGAHTWRSNVSAAKLSPRKWHRIDMYLRLSNPPAAANGEVAMTMDNVEQNLTWQGLTGAPTWNNVTRASGVNALLKTYLLPFMWANLEGNKVDIYADDVYLDITRARVELGNASRWVDCTQREIQIPTAWSPTSMTVTLNKGAFNNFTGLYLYIIDANGNVNSLGFPLSSGPPPSPPRNLRIQ